MKKSRSFVLAAFTVFYLALAAQVSTNELDSRYTPNQNSVFGSQLNNKTTASNSTEALRNTIRFSPTFLLRRKVVLFYERDLGKGFSVNAGVGKAFGSDAFQNIYFQVIEGSISNALQPGQMLSQSEFSSSTTFFSVGPKYYFSNETFDEGYIEFYYRHENMTYFMNEKISSTSVVGDRDVTFRMNAVGFGFGAGGFTGAKDNFSHDFFFQVGIKFFDIPRYELQSNQNSNPRTSFYIDTGQSIQMILLPAINIGYAFGFGF